MDKKEFKKVKRWLKKNFPLLPIALNNGNVEVILRHFADSMDSESRFLFADTIEKATALRAKLLEFGQGNLSAEGRRLLRQTEDDIEYFGILLGLDRQSHTE